MIWYQQDTPMCHVPCASLKEGGDHGQQGCVMCNEWRLRRHQGVPMWTWQDRSYLKYQVFALYSAWVLTLMFVFMMAYGNNFTVWASRFLSTFSRGPIPLIIHEDACNPFMDWLVWLWCGLNKNKLLFLSHPSDGIKSITIR